MVAALPVDESKRRAIQDSLFQSYIHHAIDSVRPCKGIKIIEHGKYSKKVLHNNTTTNDN